MIMFLTSHCPGVHDIFLFRSMLMQAPIIFYLRSIWKYSFFFWNLQTSYLKRILFSPEAARSDRAVPRPAREHAFCLRNPRILLSHIHIIIFQPRPRQILRIWYPYRTFCMWPSKTRQFFSLSKSLFWMYLRFGLLFSMTFSNFWMY